jgi:hypothetical protein
MLTIFDRKPIIDANGQKIKDLTYPSIRFKYDCKIVNVIAIDEKMQMRPDLLSGSGYGTSEQWDLILKYAGYSNPFSLCDTDVFLIPDITDMNEQLAPSGTRQPIDDAVRKQYIDVSKKAQLDPKLAEIENKRREAQRNLGNVDGAVPSLNNLPPNIAEVGDREIVVKGGKVYFGPNISKNKQECEAPLTKSEFISNLIKNRLRNG